MSKLKPAVIISPPASGRGRDIAVMLLLALVTLAVYWPVVGFDFLNYDDPEFVTSNPQVLRGLTWEGVRWAFQPGHGDYWHPLTWLSLMLDVSLFGREAWGLHLTNVLLHAANAILLFWLLRRTTQATWRSALVAALFALHPLRVESVAWVTERKDVLSTFFGLLALIFYARYAQGQARGPGSVVRGPGSGVRGPGSVVPYLASLICFALGLMTKAMVVTLPAVLLLLDYWPLNRLAIGDTESLRVLAPRRSSRLANPGSLQSSGPWSVVRGLFWEKLPFFFLSALACVVTYGTEQSVREANLMAEGSPAMAGGVAAATLTMRMQNALVAYGRYLAKTFWPVDLSSPYQHPGSWSGWEVTVAVVLVVGLSVAAVWFGRRKPYGFVGWFWFVGTLVPVIGLTRGWQQFMADRFMYLPQMGLFLVLVWGAGEVLTRWRLPRPAVGAVSALVLVACALRTEDQLQYWRNTETLFRHTIAVTGGNETAYANLGLYLAGMGRQDEGLAYSQKAIQLNPRNVSSLNNIGLILLHRQQYARAIDHFEEALRYKPDWWLARVNLGRTLVAMGKLDEGIAHFQLALRQDANCFAAHLNLARALIAKGQPAGAADEYARALRLLPDDAPANYGLGLAQVQLGRLAEAVASFEAALRADPGLLEAHNDLGSALVRLGRVEEGIAQLRLLLARKPEYAPAQDNLAVALAMKGQFDEAIVHFRAAIRLAPDQANTHFNLGNALAVTGRLGEAVPEYEAAVRLSPGSVPARLNLAQALAGLGRAGEAIPHLQEALRLNPDNPQAREQLRALGVE